MILTPKVKEGDGAAEWSHAVTSQRHIIHASLLCQRTVIHPRLLCSIGQSLFHSVELAAY